MPSARGLTWIMILGTTLHACRSPAESTPWEDAPEFNAIRPAGLLASGVAIAERRGDTATLVVRLRFMNPTAATARLEIMSATCLIRILAYSSADRRHLRYDGLRGGACLDVAREVSVSPSGTEEIVHEIRLRASDADRVGANPSIVAVIEQTRGGGFLGIDLGTVETNWR